MQYIFGERAKKRKLIFFKKVLTRKVLCAKICRSHKSGCGAVGSALPWGGRGRTFKSCHSDPRKACFTRRGTGNSAQKYAGMAELADALDSGSSGGNFVEVQVLLPAPNTILVHRNGDFFISI